ncbi:MAG: hypothetical protein IK005_03585 [Paludibacteraceae bacterium]|nr:hypothetical protein [Paludibacteraceae bacterium]
MNKYRMLLRALSFAWMLFSCDSSRQSNDESYTNNDSCQRETVVVIDSYAVKSLSPTPRIERIEYNVGEGDSIVYNMLENMTVDDVYDYYEGLDHAGFAYSDLNFRIKYTDFAMEIFEEALRRRNYKKPTEAEVKEGFLNFFGVDIDAPNKELYAYGLGRYVSDKNDVEGRKAQEDFMTNGKTTFSESFIYNEEGGFVVWNPELYGVMYVVGSYVDVSDGNSLVKKGDTVAYNITHGQIDFIMELSDLIFYADKSTVDIYKFGDESFWEDLCLKYDFDRVDEVNRLVLKEKSDFWSKSSYYEGNEEKIGYENLFFRHLPNGRLKIRDGLLAYYCEHWYDSSDGFNAYCTSIVSSLRGKTPVYLSEYSLEERMKIATYIAYYREIFIPSNPFTSFYSELKENPSFVQFIETNDYFGLEGLKEIVDKYK